MPNILFYVAILALAINEAGDNLLINDGGDILKL